MEKRDNKKNEGAEKMKRTVIDKEQISEMQTRTFLIVIIFLLASGILCVLNFIPELIFMVGLTVIMHNELRYWDTMFKLGGKK